MAVHAGLVTSYRIPMLLGGLKIFDILLAAVITTAYILVQTLRMRVLLKVLYNFFP